MLQLMTGGARTGKSYRMYAEIAETVRKGEKDVFLIVPEQFTFETEKTILKMLSNSLAARVNVMSFKSLAAFVRRQMGSRGGRYIDGGARLLIMELAVESVSDMLNIYSRPAKRPAFLKKLINAVDELKRGGVSELMLEKATSISAFTSRNSCALENCSQSTVHRKVRLPSAFVYIAECLDNLSKAKRPMPFAPVLTLPFLLIILVSLLLVAICIQDEETTSRFIPSPLSATMILL